MRGEWCYFKARLNNDACDVLLNEALKIEPQKATMGVDDKIFGDNQYRRSDIRFINNDNQQFSWVFDDLWRMAIQANRDWFGFHITNLDFIQVAEYRDDVRGEYKKHHDTFWINESPYHRKITCVIQLTDPSQYEGGDLELYDLHDNHPDKQELRTRGTAIFFPSFINHAATPVTKGTRHSLAAWFEGPKFV